MSLIDTHRCAHVSLATITMISIIIMETITNCDPICWTILGKSQWMTDFWNLLRWEIRRELKLVAAKNDKKENIRVFLEWQCDEETLPSRITTCTPSLFFHLFRIGMPNFNYVKYWARELYWISFAEFTIPTLNFSDKLYSSEHYHADAKHNRLASFAPIRQ